jgi:hypothetical protein
VKSQLATRPPGIRYSVPNLHSIEFPAVTRTTDLVAQVLPPFVHYVVFLILGAALLVLRPPPRPRSLRIGVEGSLDP